MLHGACVRTQHFLPLGESMTKSSLFFFITGVRCGSHATLWNFSPNSLLRRLETVLELIAVPFKRKIAQLFLQELTGERITVCLIEQSSLGVIFREPDIFLLRNEPSALNLTTALCTAVLEQHNLAEMSLSVYRSPCERLLFAHCMDLEMDVDK